MRTSLISAMALSCIGAASRVSASEIDGLQIVGLWSNPILAGYGIDGATRDITYTDHTSNAVYSINNASTLGESSTITSGRPVSREAFTNTIVFTGNTITSAHASNSFSLGNISYTNGDVTRVIFGATLSLYATNGSTINDYLGSTQVAVNNTNNDGGSLAANADYLTFTGLEGSLEAYEGETVQASLNGKIIGDPYFVLTSVSLDAGQSGNGFIGTDPAVAITGVSAVPLPASAPMFGAALMALGAVGYGMKRKAKAAA